MMIDHALSPPAPLAAPDPAAAPPADSFTPQEERFLTVYAESLARLQAMLVAFPQPAPPGIDHHAALLQQARQIVSRAEQMPLAALATATGLDKLVMLGHLKRVIEAKQEHVAIKGLQMLGRIHGVYDKQDSARHVALIFTEPRPPHGQAHPADLPFTLPADAYAHVPRATRDVRPPAPDPERSEGAK